jgi:phenylacetate-CoA ligase
VPRRWWPTRVPWFELHIAGAGPCRAELESQARALGAPAKFLGEVADVPALLRSAGLFVLPSLSEGLPVTVLEAMATGLPVVATAVGGTPEIVEGGRTGVLVPPGEAEPLAEAIVRLSGDPELGARMGRAGRRRVESEFDVRSMVWRYETMLRAASAGEGGRMMGAIHRHVLLPGFETLFKRRRVMRYWKELEGTQWLDAAALAELQFRNLQGLVHHAQATCPYYRESWKRLGLNAGRLRAASDLARWPVIDRETIREHRHAMRTMRPGTRLITKATGGSSGVPLTFDLDFDSNDRRTAAWHRGYGWAGAAPGTKQLYLWGVPAGERRLRSRVKDRLYQALYRRRLVSCFGMEEGFAARFADMIERDRPDAIVAYTSPIYDVARRLEETGAAPVFRPGAILIGAEKLHGFQRECIERVFRAPVFETYGSREFMLIGAECEKHAGLHLTAEHLFVEVLDDDGSPTPPGQEGNVVITDLFNYGMPFIRYANGDRAVAGFERCSCGRGLPLLRRVVGRRLDVLRTPDGRTVPGEFFPHLVKDFPGVERFQVIQEETDRVRFVLVERGLRDADRARLEHLVRAALGASVRVEFEPVASIPLTSAGKLQVVVNRAPPGEAA